MRPRTFARRTIRADDGEDGDGACAGKLPAVRGGARCNSLSSALRRMNALRSSLNALVSSRQSSSCRAGESTTPRPQRLKSALCSSADSLIARLRSESSSDKASASGMADQMCVPELDLPSAVASATFMPSSSRECAYRLLRHAHREIEQLMQQKHQLIQACVLGGRDAAVAASVDESTADLCGDCSLHHHSRSGKQNEFVRAAHGKDRCCNRSDGGGAHMTERHVNTHDSAGRGACGGLPCRLVCPSSQAARCEAAAASGVSDHQYRNHLVADAALSLLHSLRTHCPRLFVSSSDKEDTDVARAGYDKHRLGSDVRFAAMDEHTGCVGTKRQLSYPLPEKRWDSRSQSGDAAWTIYDDTSSQPAEHTPYDAEQERGNSKMAMSSAATPTTMTSITNLDTRTLCEALWQLERMLPRLLHAPSPTGAEEAAAPTHPSQTKDKTNNPTTPCTGDEVDIAATDMTQDLIDMGAELLRHSATLESEKAADYDTVVHILQELIHLKMQLQEKHDCEVSALHEGRLGMRDEVRSLVRERDAAREAPERGTSHRHDQLATAQTITAVGAGAASADVGDYQSPPSRSKSMPSANDADGKDDDEASSGASLRRPAPDHSLDEEQSDKRHKWWLRKLAHALQVHTDCTVRDGEDTVHLDNDHNDKDDTTADTNTVESISHGSPLLSMQDKQYALLLEAAHTLRAHLSHVQADLDRKRAELAAAQCALVQEHSGEKRSKLVSPSFTPPTQCVSTQTIAHDVVTMDSKHEQKKRRHQSNVAQDDLLSTLVITPDFRYVYSPPPQQPPNTATSDTSIFYDTVPSGTSPSVVMPVPSSSALSTDELQTALSKAQQSLKRVSLERTALRRKLEQRSSALQSAEQKVQELRVRLEVAEAQTHRQFPCSTRDAKASSR